MNISPLIEFAASENHVKFRNALSEVLYARLSEAIGEKTKDMVSEIFNTERVDDTKPLVEYVSSIIETAEKELGTEFSAEEIAESTNHILSLLEKKKDEEEDEDKDEEEEEDEDEDEEEEEDDEDEEEEEEEEEEKKAKKSFHFDINSHNKSNGKGKK